MTTRIAPTMGAATVSVASPVDVLGGPAPVNQPRSSGGVDVLTGRSLAALSRWVDDANAGKDREAQTWGRVAKVGEECGEVIAAYVGATGQNPRKGVTHTLDDVVKELLDVAVTALAAVEHLTGNGGDSMRRLAVHADRLVERAGISL